jgi:hypothetical protein
VAPGRGSAAIRFSDIESTVSLAGPMEGTESAACQQDKHDQWCAKKRENEANGIPKIESTGSVLCAVRSVLILRINPLK